MLVKPQCPLLVMNAVFHSSPSLTSWVFMVNRWVSCNCSSADGTSGREYGYFTTMALWSLLWLGKLDGLMKSKSLLNIVLYWVSEIDSGLGRLLLTKGNIDLFFWMFRLLMKVVKQSSRHSSLRQFAWQCEDHQVTSFDWQDIWGLCLLNQGYQRITGFIHGRRDDKLVFGFGPEKSYLELQWDSLMCNITIPNFLIINGCFYESWGTWHGGNVEILYQLMVDEVNRGTWI